MINNKTKRELSSSLNSGGNRTSACHTTPHQQRSLSSDVCNHHWMFLNCATFSFFLSTRHLDDWQLMVNVNFNPFYLTVLKNLFILYILYPTMYVYFVCLRTTNYFDLLISCCIGRKQRSTNCPLKPFVMFFDDKRAKSFINLMYIISA